MWWSTFFRTLRNWRTAQSKARRGWLWTRTPHPQLQVGKQPDVGYVRSVLPSGRRTGLCLSLQAVFLNVPDHKYQMKSLSKCRFTGPTSCLLKKKNNQYSGKDAEHTGEMLVDYFAISSLIVSVCRGHRGLRWKENIRLKYVIVLEHVKNKINSINWFPVLMRDDSIRREIPFQHVPSSCLFSFALF